MLTLLFQLLCGHALADFALQSGDMAKGKNRNRPIDLAKIPPGQKPMTIWPYWLTSHALIHAGTVGLITGRWDIALAEFVLHWMIDFAKCENWTGIHSDQALHAACKVLWTVLVMAA